ncbi:GNAT family N-acetyltransferase [Streptomyces sp. NBC_00005]|uniref:GNAT family N-acetyltransferase n=1 Tax=Streptomyces sp. NBC_00005 TaxID=2903609 RepID=UPI003252CAB4
MSNTVINAEPVDAADGRELLEEYQQELFQRWRGPLLHGQTEAPAGNTGLVPPGGLFLLARVNSSPAGCIGIRALSPDVGEIKRVFVRPAFRGQGIGRSLLAAVETEAHKLGHTRLRLDTMEERRVDPRGRLGRRAVGRGCCPSPQPAECRHAPGGVGERPGVSRRV